MEDSPRIVVEGEDEPGFLARIWNYVANLFGYGFDYEQR